MEESDEGIANSPKRFWIEGFRMGAAKASLNIVTSFSDAGGFSE
jgi:hypothetical protein